MWDVEITKVEADPTPGISQVTYRYFSAGKPDEVVRERVSDTSNYRKPGLDGKRERERLDAVKDFIANPPLGVIDFSPPVLTDEELAQQTFQQKRQNLIQAKQDLDLGLIDQATYDTQLQDTQVQQQTVQTLKVN